MNNNYSLLSKQAELIFKEGEYIGFRQYYNYMVNLYLLDDIFYEVWYFRPSNILERVSILEDEKDLDLYILSMNRENGNEIT